jgi:hypothetical protein
LLKAPKIPRIGGLYIHAVTYCPEYLNGTIKVLYSTMKIRF